MNTKDHLNEKLKDHLLTIYQLCSENRVARAKEIAARLRIRPYAVTAALRALGDLGLINYAPYDVITLTRDGEEMARRIMQRQQALADFFIEVLEVEPDDAQQAAARMEHHMPRLILDKMMLFPRRSRDEK